MPSHTKSLLLSGISVLALCGSLTAEARKSSKSDAKKAPAVETTAPAAASSKVPAGASDAGPDQPAAKPADKPADKPEDKAAAAPTPAAPAKAPSAAPGAPPPAAAAPKELAGDVSAPKQQAARSHFERGVDLYTQGDFPNAWLEFNSAYQIVPLVDLLNNMARCEVRMGRPRQALDHFQQFIVARPNDQDSEYIRQEIARLEGEVGRVATPTAAASPEPVAAAPPAPPRHVPVIGILVGTTSLAMLIAGAATLGVVNGRYNDLSGQCSPMCLVDDVSVLQRQSYAGYGLLGVGAAGAVATGLLLYFDLRSSKETALKPLANLRTGTPIGVIGRF